MKHPCDIILRIFFSCLLFLGSNSSIFSQQQLIIDSLVNELATSEEDSTKVNTLIQLAISYHYLDAKKVITTGQQALELAEKINYEEGIIYGLIHIGIGNYFMGNIKVALENYNQALSLIDVNKNIESNIIASLNNALGTIFEAWGDYDKALEYFHTGLKMTNEDANRRMHIALLTNIGNVYASQDNYSKAIEYYEKPLAISRKNELFRPLTLLLNNIGEIYQKEKKYDKALSHFQEALSVAQKADNKVFIVVSMYNTGNLYLENNEDVLAEEHLKEALSLSKEIDNHQLQIEIFLILGKLKFKQKEYVESNNCFLKSLKFIEKANSKIHEKQAYEGLVKLEETRGNYKKAFQYQQSLSEVKDSISNEKSNQQILALTTKYETQRTETENILLKEKQTKIEAEMKQKTILNCLSLVILLLVSIIAFVFFKSNQQKKKEVKLLNKSIDDAKIIEEQSKKLNQVTQHKNKLFTNITHELQTPLSIIIGFGKKLYDNNQFTESDNESLEIIIRNSSYLSSSIGQMLAINLPTQEKIPSKLVLFSLADLLDFLLPEYLFFAEEKSISIDLNNTSSSPIIIYSDLDKISAILKNIISNAIKYTNSQGTITIEYGKENLDFHEIKITDTGRGIAAEELPMIFDRYYQSNVVETVGGFGIGLAICKEYIESLNGEIKVTSTLNEGSEFTILFPKKDKEDLEKTTALYQFPKFSFQKPIPFQNQPEAVPEKENRLLIVEDNIDLCKYLKTVLEKEYYLDFAHNGQDALDYLLKNEMPSLIITDWMMQGMDGLTLVQKLKLSDEYRNLPILMLTARSLASDKIKALRVGIDDYLVKPIDEELLINSITYLIDNKEEQHLFNRSFTSSISDNDGVELSLTDQDWLHEIEQIIFPLIQNFDLNLDQISALANINSKRLNNRIKAITGLTAKKYVQEIRYWEARKMLETNEYDSVKAVCLSVGFKDSKNFARKFKRRFGKYPSAYLTPKNN